MIIDDNTVYRDYTYISVKNDLFYQTDVVINGTSLTITIGYNNRLGKRYATVETIDTTVLLNRTFLDVQRKCYFNVNSKLLRIGDYYLTVINISDEDSEDFLNWSGNYQLVIVGTDQDVKEQLDKDVNQMFYFNNTYFND